MNKALSIVFPNIKRTGCYFHYKQCIERNLGKYGFKKKEYTESKEFIISELGLLPLKYKGNIDIIKEKIDELIKDEGLKIYSNFLNNYFLKEFTSYFLDDSLNYSLIPVEARTTSSLENYNSYINRILGEKEEINWLNFLSFIKDEADRYNKIAK